MLRRRRSEGRNTAKSVLAVFWIVLAGISALYLFTLLTNPSAFGGESAKLDTSFGDATSALTGGDGASLSVERISELLDARDKELDEIKQQVRDLSQQVADLSARINGNGASPLASSSAPTSAAPAPSAPQATAAAQPAKPSKPETVAAAAPEITPPPPPEKPTPLVKP